jgi:uncharacterized protein YbjT (DUF2867 family)
MKRILITTANGMFGQAVARELLKRDVSLRLMVRDRSKCTIAGPNAEIVTADLDRHETLAPVMEGVDSVFLATPMDPRLADREIAVIAAARSAGVKQIARIFGTVKHEGDRLESLHLKAIGALDNSGIPYIGISPGSVMETSLLGLADSIRYMHAMFGVSGHGKVCLVALKDIAEATALLMTTEGHAGKNYELTGPEALDMYEMAGRFTNVLGKRIRYIDLPEEKFIRFLMKFNKTLTPERIEMEVLCHLRAWKKGNAALITNRVEELLGRKATSIDEFIDANREYFLKGMLPGFVATLMRKSV